MTDNFALLNETRRPWLDAGLLKRKFLVLSANVHPDKIHSASEIEKNASAKKFAELNAAYHCLADPKLRLRHLLELDLGMKPPDVQQIPAALANLFAEVASICQKVDVFVSEKSRATSPLLQVQLFEQAQQWIEQLTPFQKRLGGMHEQMTGELKSLDDAWIKADTAGRRNLLKSLEELYRRFSYFNRWNSQVQERITKLIL